MSSPINNNNIKDKTNNSMLSSPQNMKNLQSKLKSNDVSPQLKLQVRTAAVR